MCVGTLRLITNNKFGLFNIFVWLSVFFGGSVAFLHGLVLHHAKPVIVRAYVQVQDMEKELFGTNGKRERDQEDSKQHPAKKARSQPAGPDKGRKGKPAQRGQAEEEHAQGANKLLKRQREQEEARHEVDEPGSEEPGGHGHNHHPFKAGQQQVAPGKQQGRGRKVQEAEDADADGGAEAAEEQPQKRLPRGQRLALEAAQRKAEKQAAREEVR